MKNVSARVVPWNSGELEEIWRALEEESDHFGFQCYDWLSHWQRTIGAASGVRPAIVVAAAEGREVALFPFGMRRPGGVRTIEFLGGGQCDYNSALIHRSFSDRASVNAIWSASERALPAHDLVLLSRIPSELNDGPNPVRSVWPGRATLSACAATLAGSWVEFEQRAPKKIRNDSRRQEKKLAELGAVEFVIARDGREAGEIVTAMMEQKRRRYTETGVRDALAPEAVQAFYRGLEGPLGSRGSVHLSALRVNGTIVATHWGMVYGNRFYYLMPTFASGPWRTLSVGRLLQDRLMRWALENGFRYFDFSVGDERYKRTWCDLEMPLSQYVRVRSVLGTAAYGAMRAKSWVKTNKTTRRAIMSLLRASRRVRGTTDDALQSVGPDPAQ